LLQSKLNVYQCISMYVLNRCPMWRKFATVSKATRRFHKNINISLVKNRIKVNYSRSYNKNFRLIHFLICQSIIFNYLFKRDASSIILRIYFYLVLYFVTFINDNVIIVIIIAQVYLIKKLRNISTECSFLTHRK